LQSEGRGAPFLRAWSTSGRALTQAHHEEWARAVALARRFGGLDIAEEGADDAFATAVGRGVHAHRGYFGQDLCPARLG
jgi:hypothetical protein